MTGIDQESPPADEPPAPPPPPGKGASSHAAAAHAIAEARAQAAAAERARVPSGEADRAERDYTGLVTRAIAFGIDALIIDLVAIVVAGIVTLALSLFQMPSGLDTALAAIGAALYVMWGGAYFTTFWSTTGQTPGARMLRFRVLAPGEQRGRITPRRALVRLIAMVLAAIPLLAGYLMVLFDDRRRGLHDRLARTVVVDAPDTETPVRRRMARSMPAA